MIRVEIPAYTDRWMMGDRVGTIISKPKLVAITADHKRRETVDMVDVRLDKSGKTVRVILDDCTVIGD